MKILSGDLTAAMGGRITFGRARNFPRPVGPARCDPEGVTWAVHQSIEPTAVIPDLDVGLELS